MLTYINNGRKLVFGVQTRTIKGAIHAVLSKFYLSPSPLSKSVSCKMARLPPQDENPQQMVTRVAGAILQAELQFNEAREAEVFADKLVH